MARLEQTARTITISAPENVKITAVFEDISKNLPSVQPPGLNTITQNISLQVQKTPAASQTPLVITYPFLINSNKISINLTTPIIGTIANFLSEIYFNYIDEDRELKTLLNYGDDKQTVIINQREGMMDSDGVNTIQLKLLNPLPSDISIGKRVFLSRELGNSLIDTVSVKYAPRINNTPYLRPKNTSVKLNNTLGATLTNVTLNVLGLQTASVGGYTTSNNITFEDKIMREWYSSDFNSTELNIDFNDYNNFVFYGSAMMRLAAFREKFIKIIELDGKRQQFTGSMFTGSSTTLGAAYVLEQSAKFASEKETVIRSFDRYEQYLYFTPSGSISEYSASAYYADNGVEYNPIGYWPKDATGNLYTPYTTEAENWFTTQSLIAQRYDEFNENNLINTIPLHIKEDDNSSAFVSFVAMIGHFFDTIKPYIDQFPNIYNRQLDPNKGLSKDLMVEIADSVGFKLPTLNSLYNLSDNLLNTELQTPRRDFTVQSYKRLLHNLPYFIKTKGTKTALNALLRSFGISEELINVKEIGTSVTSSLYVFDEYTNGLEFTGNSSYIKFPLSQSLRSPFPRSVQFNVSTVNQSDMTLIRGDDKWALQIKKHPTISELGRFELTSGSTTLLTSSYQTIFDDELLNVTIRTYTSSLSANLLVMQTNDDDIIFSSSMSEASASNKFVPLWNTTGYIYIAGTGSLVTNTFEGTVDEVRLWGINLSDEMVINTAFDPGSSAGEDYTDAADYLYTQLSFNIIETGSLTSSLANESPYKDILVSPSLKYIDAVNINTGSFVRYSRTVRQILPEIGSSGYVTKKVKIASNPVFPIELTGGIKTLSRTESIVPILQKKRNIQVGRNKVSISTSPTEIINQNIIRNIGIENINAAMGSPSSLYKSLGADLKTLQEYYTQYYYVDVDINNYTRIISAVSSVLNEVIDYFIPAKATIYTGIVIEPNALEQIKISPLRQIRLYGAGTRKTINAPSSLTGSRPDYNATFNLSKTIDTRNTVLPSANYGVYDEQTENWKNIELISQSLKLPQKAHIIVPKPPAGSAIGYSTNINRIFTTDATFNTIDLQTLDWQEYRNISNSYTPGTIEYASESFQPWPKSRLDMGTKYLNKFKPNFLVTEGSDGSEPLNRLYARKLYDYEISSSRIGGLTSIYTPGLYEIAPSCDFRDIGTHTYFNQPYGIYYYPVIKNTPLNIFASRSFWNFEEQNFGNPPVSQNWVIGGRYKQGSVVYQNLSRDDMRKYFNVREERDVNDPKRSFIEFSSVSPGNGKYYIYKSNPVYIDVDSENVIGVTPSEKLSYIPPSLDLTNWELVRFMPVKTFERKRIIFAAGPQFEVSDPTLNNYLTTIVDVNKVIDVNSRYIDQIPIGSILGSSRIKGEVKLQNIALVFALQSSNANLRVRFYRTMLARDADENRSISTAPLDGSKVLLDTVIDYANSIQLINPVQTLVADEVPPGGKIFYTIDNLNTNAQIDINILLYYFAVELETRVPSGYLRKHYRFFRDNSTSTKNRNYIGCKNTIQTTIDGLSPWEIKVQEGTKLKIAAQNNESSTIITKTGGKLDINGPGGG